MDDLFKALQMFQSGVQQAATTKAVNDASQQMQMINTQMTDEAQKRVALQDLGNQLALRLVGTGANAATVSQAFNAVSPQNFGSAEQMQLEGELTGNQQLIGTAEKVIGQRRQAGIDERMLEHKLALDRMTYATRLDMMKSMAAGGGQPEVKAEDVAFATNIEVGTKLATDLEKAINRSGTWESRFGSTEDAAALDQLPYQLAITYAKIVDPNSVAREGEVDAARKYLINLGVTADKKKALQQIRNMKKTIQEYQVARGKAKGGPQAASQQEPGWQVATAPDGRRLKFRTLPDGSVEVE